MKNLPSKINKVLEEIRFIKSELKYWEGDYLPHCRRTLVHSEYYVTDLDDDPDVYGRKIHIYTDIFRFGKSIRIPVVDLYFYYEKPYKNKMEIACEEPKRKQELKFLEKLAKALTVSMVKRQLRKKSLV